MFMWLDTREASTKHNIFRATTETYLDWDRLTLPTSHVQYCSWLHVDLETLARQISGWGGAVTEGDDHNGDDYCGGGDDD